MELRTGGRFGGSQPVGAGESKPKVYRAASLKLLRAQQRGVGQQPQAHTRLAKAGVRNCFADVACSVSDAAAEPTRLERRVFSHITPPFYAYLLSDGGAAQGGQHTQ